VFTHILCPLDFSADSELALHTALRLAQGNRARLTLVTVIDPLLKAGAEAAGAGAALTAQTQQEMSALLERLGRDGLPVVTPALAIRSGNAASEIVAQAKDSGADVIVIGKRGLGGAERFFLGSTSRRVTELSPVPVLVVPTATAD
jgi:nucleotide-binding universal stress UspA family protein